MLKLGFIGTGIITESIVTGFCRAGTDGLRITVSPRNRERAARLHGAYPDVVQIAEDNQSVIDASDWVFIALLPNVAEEVLRTLRFPREKRFVSLVPTLSLSTAREIIGERDVLVDVLPLTFAAERIGPVVVYPAVPEAAELLSRIGDVIPVDRPEQIAVLRTMTANMSAYYMLLTTLVDWCVANGLDEPAARSYVTGFTGAMSRKAAGFDGPLIDLANEMTPGGLNWQALKYLREHDCFAPWTHELDPILRRVTKE